MHRYLFAVLLMLSCLPARAVEFPIVRADDKIVIPDAMLGGGAPGPQGISGPHGPAGADGAPAAGANFTATTVSGQPSSVTISGSYPNHTLNFQFPF